MLDLSSQPPGYSWIALSKRRGPEILYSFYNLILSKYSTSYVDKYVTCFIQ